MENNVRVVVINSCVNCHNLAGTKTIWWCLECVGESEYISEEYRIPSHIIYSKKIWDGCPLEKLSKYIEVKH